MEGAGEDGTDNDVSMSLSLEFSDVSVSMSSSITMAKRLSSGKAVRQFQNKIPVKIMNQPLLFPRPSGDFLGVRVSPSFWHLVFYPVCVCVCVCVCECVCVCVFVCMCV